MNGEWIRLFRSLSHLHTLDVAVHEVSDEFFSVLADSLPNLRLLGMTMSGERVAATDAAFLSLARLAKLESVVLFFQQETEDVSEESMLKLVTGPSQATLEVIRIDNENNDSHEKFEECVGEMMDMDRLQIGEIFGCAID